MTEIRNNHVYKMFFSWVKRLTLTYFSQISYNKKEQNFFIYLNKFMGNRNLIPLDRDASADLSGMTGRVFA